jgi:hypothetical protein
LRVHLAEHEYTWDECAAYSMLDTNRKRITHDEVGLCAVESGDAEWKAICCNAMSRQAKGALRG